MEERGRSRSSLSGDTLSQRSLIENSETPRRNSGPAADVSHSPYTASWVESIRDQPNFEKRICSQITSNEEAIDAKQSIIQQYNEHFRIIQKLKGSEEGVTRWRSFITDAEKQIEKSEAALMSLGPCPIPDCVRHHETPKDVEMVEHQQVLNFNYTYGATGEFKNVPLRKAAKQRIIELRSPIKTANKFNVLLNNDDQEMQCSAPLEPPKEIIPAINLKITEDYNLTKP
ncbi:hypothetical protein AVEN_128848-1 [Araneus ventricosus]|uniref:Uncharacterized protein n=1 Tax=Araneus ventricosus TaxID=182803 RepID=A0A4Y2PRD0_ARAVE|nr:hypothetical protein AVEN_128848-1 [Araneus ventricosus]